MLELNVVVFFANRAKKRKYKISPSPEWESYYAFAILKQTPHMYLDGNAVGTVPIKGYV